MPVQTRRHRDSRFLAALASALLCCACATVEHGYTTADYAQQTLALDSPAGVERLRIETEYDEAVAVVVRRHGRPGYLHVADRAHLYLFYPEHDLVVTVKRGLLPPGEIVENTRIPGHFFRLLPAKEVKRIQAKRAARRPERVRARRSKSRVAPPAARSEAAVRITGFDLDLMMQRFRTPLSAADVGVSGWRIATLADGTRTNVARSGRTEYRVQPDVVSASIPLGRAHRSAPAAARHGYFRVNRAVFGTRADSISHAVESLVAKVAADPSGRTRVTRRVAGRTVSVSRDVGRQLLVYRVLAD